jgi:hypothetical protein
MASCGGLEKRHSFSTDLAGTSPASHYTCTAVI